jgi:hypothetical protein
VGSKACLDIVVKRHILSEMGTESRILDRPARKLLAIATELYQA